MLSDKPVTFIPNYYDKLSLITLYLLFELEPCESPRPTGLMERFIKNTLYILLRESLIPELL